MFLMSVSSLLTYAPNRLICALHDVIAVAAFESVTLPTDMVIGAVNAPITGTPTAVWAAL
jgi:hypothetical protein